MKLDVELDWRLADRELQAIPVKNTVMNSNMQGGRLCRASGPETEDESFDGAFSGNDATATLVNITNNGVIVNLAKVLPGW